MKYASFILLLFGFLDAQALDAFDATYRLSLGDQEKGISQFKLHIDAGKHYRLNAFTRPLDEAQGPDGTEEILETSQGHFTETWIIPDRYYYALRQQGQTQMIELVFDWPNTQIIVKNAHAKVTQPLSEHAQDHISYLLQAMLLSASHARSQSFVQIDLDGRKNIRLHKKRQRYLSVGSGRYLAQEIEILLEDDPQPRRLWLAVQHGHVPLLLERMTPAGRVKMELLKIQSTTP